MTFVDVSENQAAGSVDFAAHDGAIIRAGTGEFGIREDKAWRQHFNACVAAGRPLGLYWFAGRDPTNEAHFFRSLVAFLRPVQVHLGYWCDAETGQDAAYLDMFRSAVQLAWCGVYGCLSNFNHDYPSYKHFGLNWLAWPSYPHVPAGMTVPDHILRQTGETGGLDTDLILPVQPYPPAWV